MKRIIDFFKNEDAYITNHSLLKVGALMTLIGSGFALHARSANAGAWPMICMMLSSILSSMDFSSHELSLQQVGDEVHASVTTCTKESMGGGFY